MRYYHPEKYLLLTAVLAVCLVLTSCGSTTEFYRSIDDDISQGDYLKAIDGVRRNRDLYGDKNSVLYNLDLGVLYHYAAESDSSNTHFFAAEKQIEDLYTKSVSLAAASLLLNDNVLPYEGEDFEKVLINIFLALNYAERGEGDEALVEARKVDLKLRQYSREYEGKNKYQEDAFIRYVAGALYESNGEVNDAFISYRKSYEAYKTYEREYGTKTPSFLLDDLVRTATLLAFDEEAAEYANLGGKYSGQKNLGSILVVAYAGKGPVKEETRPSVTIPDSSGTLHTFQIALPKFVPRMKTRRDYHISAVAEHDSTVAVECRTELAEDVTAIAAKALDDRLALIYLKSGGRALMKFLAAEKAKHELKKKEDKLVNFLGSLAVDLVVSATEKADIRTWRTLPAEFQIARLNLAPGSYRVKTRSSDGRLTIPEELVVVRPGRTSVVIVDDVR